MDGVDLLFDNSMDEIAKKDPFYKDRAEFLKTEGFKVLIIEHTQSC